jgi:hypothetical protein
MIQNSKSMGTAVAGIMFVIGVLLVSSNKPLQAKAELTGLKPSIEMLK